jgi:hypothetical protein
MTDSTAPVELKPPLELYIFNHDGFLETLASGQRQMIQWQSDTIVAIMKRVCDQKPPMLCFTCDHAFTDDVPQALAFCKEIFGNAALMMGFCPKCIELGQVELGRRVAKRLGVYEIKMGKA